MFYRNRILTGFSWHSLFKFSSALIKLGKIAILARLLTPNDFGLFSLTTIALGLTEAFTETGINTTIVQSRQSVSYFLNTAWIISIIRGLLIAVIMMILGLLLTSYYQEPQLLFLIGIASLVPLIKGFINPAIITYYKQMAFFSDTLYRISLEVMGTILAIGLTYLIRSAYALVLAILLTAIYEVIITFVFVKEKPKFEFIKSRAQTIFHNAKWLNLSALLSYVNQNADNFLIGKLAGTFNLGIYQNAYAISHKPYDVAQSVHHSTMPIYVQLVNKKRRLRQTSLKVMLLTMGLIVGISLPLFLFPKFWILLILGQQWINVIPLLRLLLIAAWLQSFSALTYTLFISTKRYAYMNVHLAFTVLILLTSVIYLGQRYGLQGAVWGVMLSRLVTLPFSLYGVYQTSYKNS